MTADNLLTSYHLLGRTGLRVSPLALGRGRLAVMQADGTIDRTHDAGNLTFAKLFTDRSWAAVATVSEVAAEIGRSPAQVALNWVTHRPGVTFTLVGATRVEQLEENLRAMEFEIPRDLLARLAQASQPEPGYPYYLLGPAKVVRSY